MFLQILQGQVANRCSLGYICAIDDQAGDLETFSGACKSTVSIVEMSGPQRNRFRFLDPRMASSIRQDVARQLSPDREITSVMTLSQAHDLRLASNGVRPNALLVFLH